MTTEQYPGSRTQHRANAVSAGPLHEGSLLAALRVALETHQNRLQDHKAPLCVARHARARTPQCGKGTRMARTAGNPYPCSTHITSNGRGALAGSTYAIDPRRSQVQGKAQEGDAGWMQR